MIHRSRQGSSPSGGPEAGRTVIRMGDTFVEYSGTPPTAGDLDVHLHPPAPVAPLDAEELYDILLAKGVVNAADRPRPKRA